MADLIIPKVWEGKEICICVTEERAVFVYDKEQDKFMDTGETAMELPPHGDLKDADRIAGIIRTKVDDVPCEKLGLYSIGNGAYRNGLKRALGIVDGAPTVLEATE